MSREAFFCTCSKEENQTAVAKWDLDGSLLCCTCHKHIIYKDDNGVDHLNSEPLHVIDRMKHTTEGTYHPDPRSLEEIEKDIGAKAHSAIFKCGYCQKVQGYDEIIEIYEGEKGRAEHLGTFSIDDFARGLLETEGEIRCHRCNKRNKIPKEWEIMFK